jgi:hypothetical protein
VAQAFISKATVGFQTILLLQITVIFFHANFIFSSLKNSIIQAGVHGLNQELSQISNFQIFTG